MAKSKKDIFDKIKCVDIFEDEILMDSTNKKMKIRSEYKNVGKTEDEWNWYYLYDGNGKIIGINQIWDEGKAAQTNHTWILSSDKDHEEIVEMLVKEFMEANPPHIISTYMNQNKMKTLEKNAKAFKTDFGFKEVLAQAEKDKEEVNETRKSIDKLLEDF